MGRRHTAGAVGNQGVGGVQVDNTTLTAADDLDITIDPSGTGRFVVAGDLQLQAQGDLRFADSDSSNYVAFQAPATVTSNVTWTLPSADGSANQALVTNASGTLSFATVSATITDNTSDSGTNYITFTTTTSGALSAARVATTTRALTYQPSTGTLSSTIFTETSSITLKENFDPIDNALEKILQLTGWIYDRKDGSQKREAGLVVEDVYPIIPNVVTLDENGNPSGINYSRFSAYLIEAVKSLKLEINELKGVK
jgi:hypothetical protein